MKYKNESKAGGDQGFFMGLLNSLKGPRTSSSRWAHVLQRREANIYFAKMFQNELQNFP